MSRATLTSQSTPVLYVALELSASEWRLAYTSALGAAVRQAVLRPGDGDRFARVLALAKAQCGLPATAAVRSCYEAGRDGFWPHWWLQARGVENVVVDSASIEVNRRAKQMKTDRLDADALVRMLVRWALGETRVWRPVRVPSPAVEAARQQSRTVGTLVADRTRLRNRIHGLLATVGVRLALTAHWAARLAAVQQWDGTPVPAALQARAMVAWRQLQHVEAELRTARRAARAAVRTARAAAGAPGAPPTPAATVARLTQLRGVGERMAWVLATEVCSRDLRNRRQVGALTGFTSAHYRSGRLVQDTGITRAGLAAIRGTAVEMAWVWVQWQPDSALTRWFTRRFARGGPGQRKLGIVALARRLVIALWRYACTGDRPAGAVLRREVVVAA
jgi:transposase